RPLIHAVGYMNRYRKSVALLKEHLAQTPMLGLSAHWVNAAYGVPWWSQKACSGGPLNEQAAHFVDLAQIVGGPIREVQVLSQLAGDSGAIGAASIQFRFMGNKTGQMFYSCMAQEKQIGFRVFTQTGELNLSGWDLQPQFAPCEPDPHRYAIFETETAIFLGAVLKQDGSAIRCRFEDAYSTQRVLEAIGRASQSGCLERVDQT
ncbi:MAG: hypothetical protein KDC71_23155, partial [Acidobacteria bacterium]|nr:hypothetical protein [Acidobacteriota bacterium]